MEFANPQYEFKGNQTVAVAKHGDDSSVWAEFYNKPVHLQAESERLGRQIYKDVNYLKITFPADRTKTWDQPVKMVGDVNGPSDPERFPRQWRAFSLQMEQVPDGTALTEFPALTKSRILELKSMNVHTVEQFAAVPDNGLENLGLGSRKERDMCQNYLNKAASLSQITRLEAENETLKADMLMLQQQIKDLGSRPSEQKQDGRRGRQPKIEGE